MTNYYLDDLAQDERCKKCPAGTYAPPGSVGSSACVPRLPCTEDDYTIGYSGCDTTTN